MSSYIPAGEAYHVVCETAARIVIDQLTLRHTGSVVSPDLTFAQQLHLVTDAMWAVHYRLVDLDATEKVDIPTPRRAIPLAVRLRVLERDGGCLNCGATTDLEVDHIIPLALGGLHGESNFQTLCGACNRRKHAQPTDYRLDGTAPVTNGATP